MKATIENLFFGELRPNTEYGDYFNKNTDYLLACKRMKKQVKIIKKSGGKRCRVALCRLQAELDLISAEEIAMSYQLGFRDGATLMADVFQQD